MSTTLPGSVDLFGNPIQPAREEKIDMSNVEAVDIGSRVLFRLHVKAPPMRKKMSDPEREVKEGTKKDRVTQSKHLYDHPAFKAVTNVQSKTRTNIRDLGFTPPWTGPGFVALHPVAVKKAINHKLEGIVSMDMAIAKLIDVYPEVLKKEQEDLKQLYNPEQYLTPNQLRDAFSMTHTIMQSGPAESMKDWDYEAFEAARAEYFSTIEASEAIVQNQLADSAIESLDRFIKVLTFDGNSEDGRKRVRQSSVDVVTEFLENWDLRKLADSKELNEKVDQLKDLFNGVDAKDFSKKSASNEWVSQFREKTEEIRDGIQAVVEDSPTRVFVFDDEE